MQFSSEALTELSGARWPGNVRELSNFIERLVVFSEGSTIDGVYVRRELDARIRLAPDEPARGSSPPAAAATIVTLGATRLEADREAVRTALEAAKGNRSQAARLLGVSRRTLYNKLAELEETRPATG